MPTITLAPALARWLTTVPTNNSAPFTVAVHGTTVGDVLASLFQQYPTLRGYVVDERGVLRHHVVAFLNNEPVTDKTHLRDAVPADGELYLAQALSGG